MFSCNKLFQRIKFCRVKPAGLAEEQLSPPSSYWQDTEGLSIELEVTCVLEALWDQYMPQWCLWNWVEV